MGHVWLSKAFGKSIDRREKVLKVGEKQWVFLITFRFFMMLCDRLTIAVVLPVYTYRWSSHIVSLSILWRTPLNLSYLPAPTKVSLSLKVSRRSFWKQFLPTKVSSKSRKTVKPSSNSVNEWRNRDLGETRTSGCTNLAPAPYPCGVRTPILLFIIWLAHHSWWADKMKRISHCDWLPERAR